MAKGREIRRCRRCSQLTAGFKTAARNRAMTNHPTNVRTCQTRYIAPSTTAAVKRATSTVRTTCAAEIRTHTTPASGTEPPASVGASRGVV
jgi:hypothetical protein